LVPSAIFSPLSVNLDNLSFKQLKSILIAELFISDKYLQQLNYSIKKLSVAQVCLAFSAFKAHLK